MCSELHGVNETRVDFRGGLLTAMQWKLNASQDIKLRKY